jgi:hypothetical protein
MILPLAADAQFIAIQSSDHFKVFTPLHLYYMSTTGNDSNNGTSPAQAWATPNHSLNCGDVIIAAAGAYSRLASFGPVSNCPSTTRGADGNGGIYFAILLCAGPSVGDCYISNSSGTSMVIKSNNWAVEGWSAGGANGDGPGRSFETDSTASGTTQLHHIAFINDISFNSNQGYDINDGGLNHNVPGNGTDYWAVVGSIAQNSAADPICLAAIDAVGPSPLDSTSGTHIFLAGNFGIANQQPAGCGYDGEALMADTLDAHGFTGQVVFKDNIAYQSERMALQLTYQAINVTTPTIKVYNNTFWGDCVGANTRSGFAFGEINIQSTTTNLPWNIFVYNNIAQTNQATSPGCGGIYAMNTGGNYKVTTGGSGIENIFKGLETSCLGSSCDSGDNVVAFNRGSIGTNTYVNPQFKNTADLTANHNGPPNCKGFSSTIACMGWNGSSLVVGTVIDDLTPTAGSMAGKGYQLPGPCAEDPDYPYWLKGVVHLTWQQSTSTILEMDGTNGLITKPCGY